ncbi:MAG: D-(-)-3-hydroxybutyrate oligomer hydrolase, partial [Parvibaculum sp.]|nr:D-(-)-3-hydroxybutyrate oligomer hydrolase [Parvibaculum sp.]
MFERQKDFLTRITGGRLHRSHYIAIGIAAAILVWFMSGLFGASNGAGDGLTAAEEDAASRVLRRVQVGEPIARMRRRALVL